MDIFQSTEWHRYLLQIVSENRHNRAGKTKQRNNRWAPKHFVEHWVHVNSPRITNGYIRELLNGVPRRLTVAQWHDVSVRR
jgi:hypothetical protein